MHVLTKSGYNPTIIITVPKSGCPIHILYHYKSKSYNGTSVFFYFKQMHTLFHVFSGGNITCFCSMIMGQKLFWTKLNTVCFICFSRRITACFCSCLKLTINKIINQRNKLFLVLICLWLVLCKTWFIVARTLAFN